MSDAVVYQPQTRLINTRKKPRNCAGEDADRSEIWRIYGGNVQKLNGSGEGLDS